MQSEHIIICVGRQLGSGGHDIGRMLAMDFNARYYDRELLTRAAKESGISERIFEQNDEHRSFLRSFLRMPNALGTLSFQSNNFSEDEFFKFQSDAIRRAADEGNCVFVGRCADYVLRDRKDTVNIFITADMEFRISQVMAKQGFSDRDEALRFIEQGEARRAAYYNYYTGKKWGMAETYDLCIDSSVLGLMETERFIAKFISKRFDNQ